jgi:hypothetical protein
MTTHTCPTCSSQLHTNGALEAWITPDGRVILLTVSAKPADHRWLELPASAQTWVAELLHQARQAAQSKPRA